MAATTIFAVFIIGFIMILGVILQMAAKKRIPPVLFLLILGIFLGPVTRIFDPGNYHIAVSSFATFALIVVLFEVGYNLKWETFKKEIIASSLLGIFGVFFSVLFVFLMASYLFGFPWQFALLLAAFLSSTDLTVVSPVLDAMNISKKLKDDLELESIINSVLAAVMTILILTIMSAGTITLGHITSTFINNIFIAIGIGLVFAYVLLYLFRKADISRPHIVSIGTVLLVYAITELIGSSGVVSALVVGMVFGNAKPAPPAIIKSFGGEMEFLLITFVYVMLGTLLDFESFAIIGPVGAFFVSMLVMSRVIGVKLVTLKESPLNRQTTYLSGPRGIVCAVLVLSYAHLFPNPDIAIGLVFISILSTTILAALLPILYPTLKEATQTKKKRKRKSFKQK